MSDKKVPTKEQIAKLKARDLSDRPDEWHGWYDIADALIALIEQEQKIRRDEYGQMKEQFERQQATIERLEAETK